MTAKTVSKFELDDYVRKKVAIKANFDSADPFPASTHIDTIRVIVKTLKGAGGVSITLAERSGMGDTEKVFEQNGVTALSKELGFDPLS